MKARILKQPSRKRPERVKKLFAFLFNKETMLYLLCGILTTVVSFVTLKLATLVLGEKHYLVSNSISWVLAVCFAFVVNKLFVFESKSWNKKIIGREIPSFFLARVASYFIEQGTLWLCMSPLCFEGKMIDFRLFSISGLMTAKVIAGVIVIIVNYVLSKFLIFRKAPEGEG